MARRRERFSAGPRRALSAWIHDRERRSSLRVGGREEGQRPVEWTTGQERRWSPAQRLTAETGAGDSGERRGRRTATAASRPHSPPPRYHPAYRRGWRRRKPRQDQLRRWTVHLRQALGADRHKIHRIARASSTSRRVASRAMRGAVIHDPVEGRMLTSRQRSAPQSVAAGTAKGKLRDAPQETQPPQMRTGIGLLGLHDVSLQAPFVPAR